MEMCLVGSIRSLVSKVSWREGHVRDVIVTVNFCDLMMKFDLAHCILYTYAPKRKYIAYNQLLLKYEIRSSLPIVI
jgi:hypothetical protein